MVQNRDKWSALVTKTTNTLAAQKEGKFLAVSFSKALDILLEILIKILCKTHLGNCATNNK